MILNEIKMFIVKFNVFNYVRITYLKIFINVYGFLSLFLGNIRAVHLYY